MRNDIFVFRITEYYPNWRNSTKCTASKLSDVSAKLEASRLTCKMFDSFHFLQSDVV